MQVACRYLCLAVASVMFVSSAGAADTPAKSQAKSEAKPAAKAEAKPAAKAETKPAAAAATSKPAATTSAAKPTPVAAAKPTGTAKPVSFKADIAPLLVKNCLACHGASDAKGDYQLHTFTAFSKPGSSGLAPVTAGKPGDSEVLRLLTSEDSEERMPKDGDPLTKDQIALVTRWINEGAKYDAADAKADLVSIVPRKPHPNPPEAYRAAVPVTALAFSPDGKELAIGGYYEITIWNTADGKLLRRIKDVEQRTFGLAYSADGKLLAAAGGTPGVSGEAALYDPAKGTVVRRLGTMADVALGCSFSPDGKQIAFCSADRSIRTYDVASGKESLLIEDHADWVMTIAWSADGAKLVSGARDKTSKVFDAKTGDSLTTYPGHSETVLSAVFAPDGKTVLSGGADKKIHVWNPADGKQSATIAGFGGEVYRVQIVDNEIWSCSADKTAKRHKLADRALIQSLTGHADYVFSLAVHPGTKRLATGGFDGEVKLWDTATNKPILSFRAAPGLTIAAAK
ncbi:MAG: PD40 domain-containing protein [Planctomycetales bacterium]|nr:PD40 domain-containing protein [Planctomycetales bacterium]MBN8624140.1 PD40 domain-containing protein [Planctomycetota bacterium]